MIRYANANLAPGEKIICLFMGNRIYYSDRDMIQADGFFRNALLRSATAGDLIRKSAAWRPHIYWFDWTFSTDLQTASIRTRAGA